MYKNLKYLITHFIYYKKYLHTNESWVLINYTTLINVYLELHMLFTEVTSAKTYLRVKKNSFILMFKRFTLFFTRVIKNTRASWHARFYLESDIISITHLNLTLPPWFLA